MIQHIVGWLDRSQRRHGIVGFPLAVVKKYGADEASKQAALLTYFGFLSLFPLLLVLTTVLKIFLHGDHSQALQQKIVENATNYIPVIGSQLSQSVGSLDKAGLALVIGVLLTLYGARGVADIFQGAVNHVWQVPYSRRTGFPRSALKSVVIILVGGFGLLSAPVISGYALNAGHHPIFKLFALLLTTALLFGLFLFLVRFAMSPKRPYGDLWVGPLVAAFGVTILQGAGTYLIANQLNKLEDLYSTFAIVLGLLFWMYLQAQFLMFALEIDSVRTLKLWPRALDKSGEQTDGDKAAYQLYAKRNNWHENEEIRVYQKPKKRSLLKRFRNTTE